MDDLKDEVKNVLVGEYDIDPDIADEVLKQVAPEMFYRGSADELAEIIYTESKYWTE